MGRPKSPPGRRAKPTRLPIDLSEYLKALAWNHGVPVPDAADLVVREAITRAFGTLPKAIRDRAERQIEKLSRPAVPASP